MDFEKLCFISKQFFVNCKVLDIEIIDSGCINSTYIVEHLHNGVKSKFVLQSLSKVFKSHEIVIENHKLITDQMNKIINTNFFIHNSDRWEIPELIKCKSNNLLIFPFESEFWRAMVYIDETHSFEFLEDKMMAYETGLGLAKFHLLCSDIDSSKLEESISNFHDTNYYIEKYLAVIKNFDFTKLNDIKKDRVLNLVNCLKKHLVYVKSLYKSIINTIHDYNVIHGDPKLSNFLFDIKSKHVVSLIDLDTVSSGYLLIDLADCIRSICNLAGEDPHDLDDVSFDINCCKYFLRGYFSIINKKGNHCFGSLPEFVYLIIVELTVRFLSDFLQSNKYFKIKYQTHNLYRAESQYRLLSSFVSQVPIFSNLLQEIGFSSKHTFVSDVQKIV